MPVQIVATASPHCAHRRYPQASLVLVRGVWEAARGNEGSPPSLGKEHPGQGWLPAAHRALTAGGMQTGGKHQLYCWHGRDPTWDLPKVTCTAHSCQKRQLLVIIDGRQQPECRRMHTPVGNVTVQSNLVQNRNLGGFPSFLCFLKPAQFQEHFLLKDS